MGGQGIALGRIPMIAEHLRDGRLVAPFARRYDSARGYFAIAAPGAAERPDVVAFMRWLDDEADAERGAMRARDPAAAKIARASRVATAATRRNGKRVGA